MSKVGGTTVYNKFIFGEIAEINNLIQEIKSTLQVILIFCFLINVSCFIVVNHLCLVW